MSLGGGTKREMLGEQSQVPEDEADSEACIKKVVAVCRKKGEPEGSGNRVPSVFDKSVEDHGEIKRCDSPYLPDQEMEEMVSQVVGPCTWEHSLPRQAHVYECGYMNECDYMDVELEEMVNQVVELQTQVEGYNHGKTQDKVPIVIAKQDLNKIEVLREYCRLRLKRECVYDLEEFWGVVELDTPDTATNTPSDLEEFWGVVESDTPVTATYIPNKVTDLNTEWKETTQVEGYNHRKTHCRSKAGL